MKQDFDLGEFSHAVFAAKSGEKVCILIDLENPVDVKEGKFLNEKGYTPQKKAYEIFYEGLKKIASFGEVNLFAYRMTGGHDLELPGDAMGVDGEAVDFKKDIYEKYDIVLSMGTFSATAPLAAAAQEYGFRGARFNEMSGLSGDYKKNAAVIEKARLGMTGADSATIEFLVGEVEAKLHLYLGDQVAQKVDGICHKKKTWTSLPTGKVYFVPFDAEGSFPMKFTDGGIALIQVGKGCIKKMKLLSGESASFLALQKKIESDKAFGIIGEFGFATNGTFHFGIGRNDYLKGSINLDRFKDKKKAAHQDILFSKERTPEIKIKKLILKRDGKEELLIKDNEPEKLLFRFMDIS